MWKGAIYMAIKQIQRVETDQQLIMFLEFLLVIGGFFLWMWYARKKGYGKTLNEDLRMTFFIGSYLAIICLLFFAFILLIRVFFD